MAFDTVRYIVSFLPTPQTRVVPTSSVTALALVFRLFFLPNLLLVHLPVLKGRLVAACQIYLAHLFLFFTFILQELTGFLRLQSRSKNPLLLLLCSSYGPKPGLRALRCQSAARCAQHPGANEPLFAFWCSQCYKLKAFWHFGCEHAEGSTVCSHISGARISDQTSGGGNMKCTL